MNIFLSSNFRQRKSVIVPYHQPKRVQKYDLFDDENSEDEYSNVQVDIDCSIIKTLCSTYFVQEDNSYLEKMKDTFERTRTEINLGQEIVSGFIKFCQNREQFSPAFWKGVSRQMR